MCFIIHSLNNLQKKTPLSEFAEKGFENTTQMRGSETRQNFELSCQLHVLLYIDCMLSTNQIFHGKSNV